MLKSVRSGADRWHRSTLSRNHSRKIVKTMPGVFLVGTK